MRKGDWKLNRIIPPYGSGNWQLFDLANDPYEKNDLAASNPDQLGEMLSAWDRYRERVALPEDIVFDGNQIKQISHYQLQELLPGYGQ